MKETKNKIGRPSNYKDEFAEQARKLCLLGATDEELANFFEVTETTINNWKKDYPQFFESIKKGKIQADSEIANKLYHRASGYEHEEDDIRAVNGEIVITPTIKHYPPDTTAAIFWLKNRQPRLWRDKQNLELTGKDGEAIQHEVKNNHTYTPEELAQLTPQELSRLAIDGKV